MLRAPIPIPARVSPAHPQIPPPRTPLRQPAMRKPPPREWPRPPVHALYCQIKFTFNQVRCAADKPVSPTLDSQRIYCLRPFYSLSATCNASSVLRQCVQSNDCQYCASPCQLDYGKGTHLWDSCAVDLINNIIIYCTEFFFILKKNNN